MAFGFGSLFKSNTVGKPAAQNMRQEYAQMEEQTGLSIIYEQHSDGTVIVSAISPDAPAIEVSFPSTATDEARILYMIATELLRSRAAAEHDHDAIRAAVEGLFASYRR